MGTNGRIDLLAPGLFGPIQVSPDDLPRLPSLSLLLGRAYLGPARGSDPLAVLFDRFGLELDSDLDPPSAPFSRLADATGSTVDGYWLHADPVHLRPHGDQLLLFDARHMGLEREEVDSLRALFNGHFAADGLRLETPTAQHWYLKLDGIPRLRTQPLADLVGRAIGRSCLDGEDAARWTGWLNEAQMLFHEADVNQRRELDGKTPVSGIWPWGGGSLPLEMPQCPYGSVFAGDSLSLGLAKAARIAAHPLPDRPGAMLEPGRGGQMLLCWDAIRSAVLDGDAETWTRELKRFDWWLDELFGLLKGGKIAEMVLYPCDGTRLVATSRGLRRLWRRPVRIGTRIQGVHRH